MLACAFLGVRGQVVNHCDSNYMSYHYDPYPPMAGNDRPVGRMDIAMRGDVPNQYGDIYPVDSVEHIYGIAFSADTMIHRRWKSVRDQSLGIGLYLYRVPRGTSDITLLDSIVMHCNMPYKMLVYESLDTFVWPWRIRHDTVPVFERLFSREYEFGVDDSILVTFELMPWDTIGDRLWLGYQYTLWGGYNTIYSRCVYDYTTYVRAVSGPKPGPVFAIRHRECPKLEGLRVDTVDGTTVCLSWHPTDTDALYRVEYGPVGFWYGGGKYGEGIVADSVGDTTFCATGLSSDKVYAFYVSAYCPTMRQYGMPDSVHALTNDNASCPRPGRFRLVGITATSAKVAWDTVEGQQRYEMLVKRSDDSSERRVLPDSNPYELSDMAAGVMYSVWLRAECHHECAVHDTVLWGPWSAPLRLAVGEQGVGESGCCVRGATVVPNPAHGYVTVVLPEGVGAEGTVTMADMAGRVLLRQPLLTDRQRVDVSALPAGTYFVTLTMPAGSTTQKLVVE